MPISMKERGEKAALRAAEADQIDREKCAKFIRDPINWPRYPMCPLKLRNGRFGEPDYCGFLLNVAAPPYKVYLGYIYALNPNAKSWAEATKDMKTEEYGNIEALLNRWTVD